MNITLNVQSRDKIGRGEARRLRRAGRVPAIVYGGASPQAVDCETREIMAHMQNDSFHSTLLNLRLNGKEIKALVREIQMHPYRREIIHIDFQTVRADSEIAAAVPIHFINVEDSPGVKLHHGIFTAVENQVAVHCLPKDLPPHITIDVGNLEIGKNIHLSEVPPPAGVRYDAATRGDDPVLAIISEPRVEPEETPADATDEVVTEAASA